MVTAYTTCSAMCGSGCRIGMTCTITNRLRRAIHKVQRAGTNVGFEAAPHSIHLGALGRRTASGRRRMPLTKPSASGALENNNQREGLFAILKK